jgi:hypothetical protein
MKYKSCGCRPKGGQLSWRKQPGSQWREWRCVGGRRGWSRGGVADNQGLRIRVDRVVMRVVQRRVGKAKRSG